MTGISFNYGISHTSSPCRSPLFFIGRESSGLTCPGIYVVKSFGIQLTKATIFGRIDVFKSIFVRLDSLTASMPESAYDKTKEYRDFDTHGVIRMGRQALERHSSLPITLFPTARSSDTMSLLLYIEAQWVSLYATTTSTTSFSLPFGAAPELPKLWTAIITTSVTTTSGTPRATPRVMV